MKKCDIIKIVPHRSYRRLNIDKRLMLIEGFVLMLFILGIMYIFITSQFNMFIEFFYNQLQANSISSILTSVDIFGVDIKVVDMKFAYLQPLTNYIWALVLLLLYVITIKHKIFPYNVSMWFNFFIVLMLIFVTYFIFFSKYFPYTLVEFSELYITAVLGFIFFCSVIMMIILLMVPFQFLIKLLIFGMTLVYFMLFSLIRFGLTVLLVSQVSVVFAPMMFFTLYLDFFFFISVYSYILYWKSIRMKRMEVPWKW